VCHLLVLEVSVDQVIIQAQLKYVSLPLASKLNPLDNAAKSFANTEVKVDEEK